MTDPAIRQRDLPWPTDVDPARWLMGATSSGEPHRRAVVATWQEICHLRAQVAAVRTVADDGEWRATRWADPLPVPEWVARVRAALDEVAW